MAAATAGLLLAGCTSAGSTRDAASAAPRAARPSEGAALDWKPCPGHRGVQCARLRVPMDYAHPGGATVRLALNRLPATDRHHRLGALLTNPGGPGGSGLDDVYQNAKQYASLRTRYDIVGMDPRGVGRSDPVKCLGNKALDAYYTTDFTPDTARERAAAVAAVRRYVQACRRNTGPLLGHVGTENVVRDMEMLRLALGEQKLNFFGTSYGTQLGQKYAARYPGQVGRMVLDSVDDPAQDAGADASGAGQAQAMDRSIRQILARCGGGPAAGCPIGSGRAARVRVFTRLLARLDRRPLRVSGGRELTDSLARIAAVQATYAPDELGRLLVLGTARAEHGDGAFLLQLSDAYLERDSGTGRYSGQQAANTAVTCLVGNRAAYRRRSAGKAAAELAAQAADASRAAPLTGEVGVYTNAQCDFWPLPPTAEAAPVYYRGSAPILIVNNSGDTATPLADARRVASRMRGSRLVVNEAAGHSAYTTPSTCLHRVVNRYLLDGDLPPSNTTCSG